MNKPYLLLALVAVGAGAVYIVEEQRIGDLRKLVDSHAKGAQELSGKLHRAEAELAELRNRTKVFKDESESLRKQLAESRSGASNLTAAADGSTSPTAKDTAGGWMKSIAKMFTDPEMKKSMKVQQLMGVRMMYSDLAKELGLDAQETEQLMELLGDRQMDLTAAAMTAAEDGAGTPEEQRKRIEETQKRYEDQLKAVLGEDRFAKMKSYEATMGDRWMMQQFKGQFSAANAALEPQQKEQLLTLMREERAKMPDQATLGASGNPAKQMELLRSDEGVEKLVEYQQDLNRRVLGRAREMLTADQIVAFEKMQMQQLDLMKTQLKMSRQMMGLGK